METANNNHRLCILHVDDDSSMLTISKQILLDLGAFEIDHAISADDAFEKLTAKSYDVVVSDYDMPQKDGLEFLKELREQKNDIPFILFTGKGREEIAIKALNLGANYYLNKHGSVETVYGELAHSISLVGERRKVENELTQKQEILEHLVENIGAGLTIIDKDYRIVWANQMLKLVGATEGKTCYSTYNKLDQVCPDCGVKKIFEEKAASDVHEYNTTDVNGEYFCVELIVNPIKNASGQIIAATELAIPITARKKTEKQIKESEERFRQLFANMPSGVAVYTAVDEGKDFVFKDFNESAERIEQVSRKDVIGKRLTEIFPGVKDFGLFDVLKSVYQTGAPEFFPINIYRDTKDPGTWRENWVYKLPNGDVVAIYEDVTKRKKAELALRESEQRWVTTLSSIGDAVIATDIDGKVVFMNPVAEHLTGWSLVEASQKMLRQVFYIINEETRLPVASPVEKVIAQGVVVGLANHTVLIDKTGREIPISDSAAPIRNDEGKISGVVLVFRDVTERRKVRKELENMAKFPMENPDPVLRLDNNGKIIFANPASSRIATENMLEPGSLAPETWRTQVAKALLSKEKVVFEEEQNGKILEFKVAPIASEGYANLYTTDITERKKNENAVRQSEMRYRSLYENVSGGVVVQDLDGRIVEANNLACELLGLTFDQVIGRTSMDPSWHSIHEDGSPFLGEEHPAMITLKTGNPIRNVTMGVFHPADNGYKWLQINSEPIIDYQTAKVTGVMTTFVDITQRKAAEALVKDSQEELQAVLLNAPIGIATTDSNFNILTANKAFCGITGYSEDELQRLTFKDFTHPDDVGKSTSNMLKLKSGEISIFSEERRHIRKNGIIRYGKVNVSAIRDKEGNSVTYIVELEDITELKKAEKALIDSEERYRELYEKSPYGYQALDAKGKFIQVDDSWLDLLGYSREEVLGNWFGDFLHPQQVGTFQERFPYFLAAGKIHSEFEMKRKDGTYASIAFEGRIAYDIDGNFKQTHCLLQDITERKKIEDELKQIAETVRQRAEELERVMDVAPVALWVSKDPECKTIIGNRAANQFYEAKTGENVSAGPATGGKQDFTRHFFQNGKELKPEELPMQKAASEKVEIRNTELEVLLPSGRKITLLGNASPLLDNDGTVRGCVGSFLDISTRKITEEELLRINRQIQIMNEKLHVVGRLTRHDLANKLMIIQTSAYLLKKKIGENPELAIYLDSIDAAIKSSNKLFDFNRMYEKIGVEDLSTITVEECFNQALALTPDLDGIKVVNKSKGLVVNADSYLRQIFYNLLDNTKKHGKKATTIKVYFEQTHSGDLQIVYEDDGVGISAEHKPKLFTEGFSTRASTGYGLFLIRKMMDVYGWTIQETGEPEKGAKFIITIPKGKKNTKESFQICDPKEQNNK